MSRGLFCRILLIAVVVVGVLGFSGTIFAQGRSREALEHVRQVQERNTARLMANEGVVGTAVGFGQSGRHGITVFIANSVVSGIPRNLEGVPVNVVVSGQFYALGKPPKPDKPDKPGKPPKPDEPPEPDPDPVPDVNPWDWCRPVPIGVSTGHFNITAGTIGCRVTDGINVYALSNNHVFANSNNAFLGDNILQPQRPVGRSR